MKMLTLVCCALLPCAALAKSPPINPNCDLNCSYGITYPHDHEVDTACVDFCLDHYHTLTQCTRSCSN